MPRYNASTPPRTKRKRQPSVEDSKAAIAVTTNTASVSNAPSQKRPRRAAALKAESRMQIKDEEDDIIPPKSTPSPANPEPSDPKLEPDAKVEVKAEPNSSGPGLSKAPAKQGRRTTTKQTPTAGQSTARPSGGDQETAKGQDGALIPSEAAKKGGNKGPSKASVTKGRVEKWKKWCDARKWISQRDPGYKQKVGDEVVHRSDAMSYYRFKHYEIDTIPYVAFENQHNPNSFGRAYNNANLRTLASRKLAYLAGLDEQFDPETKEIEFLKAGWELFQAETKKREEAYMKQKGKRRKSLVSWDIVPPRTPNTSAFHHHGSMKNRPFGSWSTRVYEDDRYIGDYLHFQFDPYANDFADFYGGYERFWPRGADWAWELGGLCSCCDL